MRAIFMIPTKPPPSFREPDRWSPELIDFVSKCLVKNPEERASASQLLHHEFIGKKLIILWLVKVKNLKLAVVLVTSESKYELKLCLQCFTRCVDKSTSRQT